MDKTIIIALFGPAGSGKDYLLRNLFDNKEKLIDVYDDISEIISQTTRPPRDNEQDGVNYYFKTEEQFLKDIKDNNLLEWTTFRDWYYGTNFHAMDMDAINIGVFNVTGIQTLLTDSRVKVIPVAVTASPKTRLIRQLTREENPDVKEIIRRFGTDAHDFEYLDFERQVFVNESLSDLAANVDAIGMLNKFTFEWHWGEKG